MRTYPAGTGPTTWPLSIVGWSISRCTLAAVEVDVDVELHGAPGLLGDRVVVVVAGQDEVPAILEPRPDRDPLPLLGLLAVGQQRVRGKVDEDVGRLGHRDDGRHGGGQVAVVGKGPVRDVRRAEDVDLVDALGADDAGARRVVDADPAVVALEHEELVIVEGDDGGEPDVATLAGIGGGGRRRRPRRSGAATSACGSS